MNDEELGEFEDGEASEEHQLSGDALIAAHRKAKRHVRQLRMVFPLVVILIVVLNLFGLVGQVKGVDVEALVLELEMQANKLWPTVEDHLAELAMDVQPILSEALAKQSAIMGPEIERKLASNAEEMKVVVERDFISAVEKSLEEIDRRQRQVLVDEIPALKGDRAAQDKVMQALRDALVKWAMHELTTTFHGHLEALEDIRKTLQSSYIAPVGEKADPQEALLIWLDLMNERIGGESTILGDGPEPEAKKKKSGKAARKGPKRTRAAE